MSRLADGSLRPGESLPTEIELAEHLSVSRTTVRQAFAQLERGGFIRRVRGKGTFISEEISGQSADSSARKSEVGSLYGLVLPEIHHGFYPVLQRSFSNAAQRLHRQVVVCNSDQNTLRQADMLFQLADRQVGGIAVLPTSTPELPTPAYQIRPLQAMGIPVVFCHRGVDGVRAPLVTFSGLDVGRAAGRALVQHGHERIAFFATHHSKMADFYLQGLRQVLIEAGVELPDANVFYGTRLGHAVTDEHEAAIRRKLEDLLGSSRPPTAIFTSFDSEAELIFLLLTTQFGVNIPNDMSLMGIGGNWRVSTMAQRLTSVVVDEDEIGRRAIAFLDQMQRGERPLHDAEVSVVGLAISEGKTLATAPGVRR